MCFKMPVETNYPIMLKHTDDHKHKNDGVNPTTAAIPSRSWNMIL